MISSLKLLRINQWIKNLFMFAPLMFSKQIFRPQAFIEVFLGFVIFSLASSSVYIFNDLQDINSDKQHPQKKNRPLPSGKISQQTAARAAIFLSVISLGASFYIDSTFGFIVLTYIIINVFYSIILKHLVILDVMVIAAGFVLRVLAGAAVVKVYPSNWLLICTTLLALFLGFSKRRHELVILAGSAYSHRKVLEHYNTHYLDQMIAIVTAATVMSYMLYTVSEETVKFFGTRQLIWTVPFVFYGIFRYLFLIHKKEKGGDPAEIMIQDKPLLINLFLWIISVIIIIYVIK